MDNASSAVEETKEETNSQSTDMTVMIDTSDKAGKGEKPDNK